VIRHHKNELEEIKNENERINKLVELNVLEQIENIKQTSIYKKAIGRGEAIRLHAWVFDFSTGLVHDLKKKYNLVPAVV